MAKNKLAKLTAAAGPTMPTPYRPSPAEKQRELRYKAEDALRTIQRYEEIKRDRPLMSAVKKVAHEQIKALSCVTGKRK